MLNLFLRTFVTSFFIFFLTSSAYAQNNRLRMKFVFPFGIAQPKICPTQYKTDGGCCEPPQSIYQYNPTTTGCCTSPNEVYGTGTNKRCCAPLPTDYIRWSQAPSNICGDYIMCGAGAVPNAEGTACVCDTASGYGGTWQKDTGSGNGCAPLTCEGKLIAAGANPLDITVSDDTITIEGTLYLDTNLDLSTCHLIINATDSYSLYLTGNATLKVKSLKVTSNNSSGYAVGNSGIIDSESSITVENANGGYAMNNKGTIETGTLIVKSLSGYAISSAAGALIKADSIDITVEDSYALANKGVVETKSIKVTANSPNTSILSNDGIFNAITIESSGGSTCLENRNGGTLTVDTVTTKNCYNYGVNNTSSATMTVNIILAESESKGVSNLSGAILKANSIMGTGFNSNGTGVHNNAGSIEAETIIGTGGVFNSGTIKAETITGTGSTTTGISNSGTIEAETLEGSSTGAHGIFNSGTIEVETVSGEGKSIGINNTGTIITATSVTGTSNESDGTAIRNVDGTIKAPIVKGMAIGGGRGIYNTGTVDADAVTGTATDTGSRGIYNGGIINADTIAGTGEDYGFYVIGGSIDASTSVIGTATGTSGNGILLNVGTIIAPIIYYCPKTSGTGTFTGTKVCKSGCTCTN